MSDEKQETTAAIIAEMRNLGKLDEKSTDKIPRSLMALGLRTYADRLDAASQRVASKMHALQLELWQGKKMGAFAFALALEGFESALSATTAPAKGGAQ